MAKREYYIVPATLDGRRTYHDGNYYELTKDELLTEHECKRYGVPMQLLVQVKITEAFWFFGKRFKLW